MTWGSDASIWPIGATKPCQHCGATMQRENGTKAHDFGRRKYCGHKCAGLAARLATGDERPVPADAGSEALLRALLRYGLRHDGLPGLPAVRLLEMARAMRVAA